MSDGENLKFTDPDQGMMKLNLRPKVVQRGKCSTEVYDNGQVVVREEHEPDEELENLPQTKGKVDAFMTVSNNDEPALRVRIRICKHCGCLYAEKS
jgi:Rieske Fe-S protein